MHGVHHSVVRAERDGNFASLFTMWDHLHGTMRLNVPQDEIEIGVPTHREPQEVTLGRVLTQPFRRSRPSTGPDVRDPEPEGPGLQLRS